MGRYTVELTVEFDTHLTHWMKVGNKAILRIKLPAASSGVPHYRKSLRNFTASGGEYNPERFKTIAATPPAHQLCLLPVPH